MTKRNKQLKQEFDKLLDNPTGFRELALKEVSEAENSGVSNMFNTRECIEFFPKRGNFAFKLEVPVEVIKTNKRVYKGFFSLYKMYRSWLKELDK